MAANPVPLSKKRIKIVRRRPFGLAFANRTPAKASDHQGSAVMRAMSAVLITPAVFAMLAFVAGAVLFLTAAFVQRKLSPMNMVVVQQFEVSPELSNHLSMTGKSASDIFIDDLNQHAAQGAQFDGVEYYAYDVAGAQSIALRRAIKIPVQSSYGIEVKGISIDNLVQIYNRVRYKEWLISGNITSSGDRIIARLRLNRNGAAHFWQVSDSIHGDFSGLIQSATDAMLADENPELLGRSYLQRGDYQRAADIFRRWTLAAPRDWRPSYYLSLAFDYQGKDADALCMARWSQDVAEHEKELAAKGAQKHQRPVAESSAELAEVTMALSEINAVPHTVSSRPDADRSLHMLRDAEGHLQKLSSSSPMNSNYLIQLARSLDREAEIESSPLSGEHGAFDSDGRAVVLLDKAILMAPENGGLYEQRSIFLQHQVLIGQQEGRRADLIATLKRDETDGFRRALELKPGNISPLWGAVYGLLDRHEAGKAIELAHTIMLLQPNSTTAEVAYVFSLEEAGLHKDATENLARVLDKASETELPTLWHCFRDTGDSKSAKLIAAAVKRRFPHDVAFLKS
jgi:tetratricopeptide (TPR) repeat protein